MGKLLSWHASHSHNPSQFVVDTIKCHVFRYILRKFKASLFYIVPRTHTHASHITTNTHRQVNKKHLYNHRQNNKNRQTISEILLTLLFHYYNKRTKKEKKKRKTNIYQYSFIFTFWKTPNKMINKQTYKQSVAT